MFYDHLFALLAKVGQHNVSQVLTFYILDKVSLHDRCPFIIDFLTTQEKYNTILKINPISKGVSYQTVPKDRFYCIYIYIYIYIHTVDIFQKII